MEYKTDTFNGPLTIKNHVGATLKKLKGSAKGTKGADAMSETVKKNNEDRPAMTHTGDGVGGVGSDADERELSKPLKIEIRSLYESWKEKWVEELPGKEYPPGTKYREEDVSGYFTITLRSPDFTFFSPRRLLDTITLTTGRSGDEECFELILSKVAGGFIPATVTMKEITESGLIEKFAMTEKVTSKTDQKERMPWTDIWPTLAEDLKEMAALKNDFVVHMEEARGAALYATCEKKRLGCALICHDHEEEIHVIRGWNGPPDLLKSCSPCPRLNDHRGTNLGACRAVHAERRTLLHAAYHGIPTKGGTLFSYMGVPCKDCLLELIEAGVKEIVCLRETYYDELSKSILKEWTANGGRFRVVPLTEEKEVMF